jgi:hypothetical protein
VKKDLVEIKAIGKDYIIIQRNGKGVLQRMIGKMKGRKNKSLLSLAGIR